MLLYIWYFNIEVSIKLLIGEKKITRAKIELKLFEVLYPYSKSK